MKAMRILIQTIFMFLSFYIGIKMGKEQANEEVSNESTYAEVEPYLRDTIPYNSSNISEIIRLSELQNKKVEDFLITKSDADRRAVHAYGDSINMICKN